MEYNSILEVFLGGTTSFLVAFLILEINKKRKLGILKSNIKDELMGVCDALKSLLQKNGKGSILINTPIWEAVVSSAFILDLVHNKEYYDSVIDIYFSIERLKKEELANINGDKHLIIKNLREEVCKKIDGVKI